jgi:His-Xaa-Ser system protein HxsD
MAEQKGELLGSLTVVFAANVYTLDTIKKAAYPFTDKASFLFRVKEERVVVEVTFTPACSQPAAYTLIADFKNEVLDQDLRKTIAEETAPVRNAVLGYAFSRTGLQGD